jgi:hypothetical protein
MDLNLKDVCAQFGHTEPKYQTLAEMIFKPLRYEVIFRGACTSWGEMRARENNFFIAIFMFSVANLSGNDFQTITL